MPGTRKLGKTTAQRKAMLRQQVTDFLDKGKMETTLMRCKEVAPLAEKMITLGKKNDLAAYRQAMSFITREDVVKKLFKEIAMVSYPASLRPLTKACIMAREGKVISISMVRSSGSEYCPRRKAVSHQ